jgi:phosphohistidine phosphatase
MKIIILVRHATAVDRGIEMPDFDRNLIKKGRKESKKMAKVFHDLQITPGIWISSPAPRALETAEIFAGIFQHLATNILQEEKLYSDNTANVYMNLIRTIPDDQNSVILFGHDPAISDFAALLLKKFNLSFQKGGVVVITHLTGSWQSIEAGSGFLTTLEFPKKDRSADSLIQDNLQRLFSVHNQQLYSKVYPKYHKKIMKIIEGTGGKIAKKIAKILRNK